MKKGLFILMLLLIPMFVGSCSSDDDSSDENNVLSGTSWYNDETTYVMSFSFSVGNDCHYMSQMEGKDPIISYYKYRVLEGNRVEVYKGDGNSIYYVGEFTDEVLTITHKGSGEIVVYKRNNHGL